MNSITACINGNDYAEGDETDFYFIKIAAQTNIDVLLIKKFFKAEIMLFWFYPEELDIESSILGNGILSMNIIYKMIESSLKNGCIAMKFTPGMDIVLSELFGRGILSDKIGNHIFFSKSKDIIRMIVQNNSFIDDPDKSINLKYETTDYIMELKNAYDFLNLEIKKKKEHSLKTFKIKTEEFLPDFPQDTEFVHCFSTSRTDLIYDYIEVSNGEKSWHDFTDRLLEESEYVILFKNAEYSSMYFKGNFDTIFREFADKWKLTAHGNIYRLYEDLNFFITVEKGYILFSNTAGYYPSGVSPGNEENSVENSFKFIEGKEVFEFSAEIYTSGQLKVSYSFYEGNLEKSVYRFYKK